MSVCLAMSCVGMYFVLVCLFGDISVYLGMSVFGYVCVLVYLCRDMPVFGHVCVWVCLCLGISVFGYVSCFWGMHVLGKCLFCGITGVGYVCVWGMSVIG